MKTNFYLLIIFDNLIKLIYGINPRCLFYFGNTLPGENFMAIFTTLSVVIWFSLHMHAKPSFAHRLQTAKMASPRTSAQNNGPRAQNNGPRAQNNGPRAQKKGAWV